MHPTNKHWRPLVENAEGPQRNLDKFNLKKPGHHHEADGRDHGVLDRNRSSSTAMTGSVRSRFSKAGSQWKSRPKSQYDRSGARSKHGGGPGGGGNNKRGEGGSKSHADHTDSSTDYSDPDMYSTASAQTRAKMKKRKAYSIDSDDGIFSSTLSPCCLPDSCINRYIDKLAKSAKRLNAQRSQDLSVAGIWYQRFYMVLHLWSFTLGMLISCSTFIPVVAGWLGKNVEEVSYTLLTFETIVQILYIFEFLLLIVAGRDDPLAKFSMWNTLTQLYSLLNLIAIVTFWGIVGYYRISISRKQASLEETLKELSRSDASH